MKHAILGAGAVGGLVGAALASLGEDVTVVVRPERLAQYPAILTLERPSGVITAPAKGVTTLTEPVDVLWIATKTYQLQTALDSVKSSPTLRRSPAERSGSYRGAAGAVRSGSRGARDHRGGSGEDRSGPICSSARPSCASISLPVQNRCCEALVGRLAGLGFTCQFVSNEQTLLWSKLCFLAPFALVTSASGMNQGESRREIPSGGPQLASAIAEACAVAEAIGAEVDAPTVQAILDGMAPDLRSSMAKDLAAAAPARVGRDRRSYRPWRGALRHRCLHHHGLG